MEDEDIKKIEEERRKKINFEMRNRHTRDFKINYEIKNDYGGYRFTNQSSRFDQTSYNHQNNNQSAFRDHQPTNQSTFRDQMPNTQSMFRDHQPTNKSAFRDQMPNTLSTLYNHQPTNQGFLNQSSQNPASYTHPANIQGFVNQSFYNNQSIHNQSLSLPLPINLDNTLHRIPTNITQPEPPSYSLKLSSFYYSNFVFKPDFHQIENAIRQEAQHAISDQILKLKIEINKRLNQVNNDPDKVEMIGNMLKVYSNNHIFIDIFTCKFIEQSTVQISRNLDLYRPFGHLFKKVFTNSLFDFYKASVIQKSGDGPALKGIYGGFFGVLIELDFVDELWAFGAGLLNGEYNENTFVVLEVYLIVGGEYLKGKSKRQYEKLQRYIKKNVLHEIKDKALKFRIGSLV